jgi:hypothetical protein
MLAAAEADVNKGFDLINSTIQDFLNRNCAAKGAEPPTVGITLTCPAFDDSPIIGTLLGFEEISGRAVQDVIGRNCRFLNKGCQNDKSAIEFMRKIQESPDAARQFTRAYPEGKEFLLMNVRPTRTKPQAQASQVYFFNLIHIFGLEVPVEGASHPVLVGVQWAMLLDSNIAETTAIVQHIHRLLVSQDSPISEVFAGWCTKVLSQFIQLEKASLRETGLAVPVSLEERKPDFDSMDATDCRDKITQLIGALMHAEELAKMLMERPEAPGEESANARHLAQAQLADIVGLRAEVFTEFRADLLQFVSWYIVKANLEGSLNSRSPEA